MEFGIIAVLSVVPEWTEYGQSFFVISGAKIQMGHAADGIRITGILDEETVGKDQGHGLRTTIPIRHDLLPEDVLTVSGLKHAQLRG